MGGLGGRTSGPAFCIFMGKSTAPSPSEHDWQAEDDHRTMMRASEVKGDPKRMAGVKKHHRKQTRALANVGRSIGGKR